MSGETRISGKDWDRLLKEFGSVHGRINKLDASMTEKVNRAKEDATAKVNASHNALVDQVNNVNTDLQTHKASPCQDVKTHENRYHSSPRERSANGDAKKFWTIVIAVVTGVSAGIGFLLALLKEIFSS